MAKYRHVYCKFWNDPEVLEYTPEDRYFYLYLITNEHSTQCGIYEISKKVIAFETGYNQDTVENLINRFEKRNKIEYDRETNEIAILNWSKYNLQNTGKPILDCIRKELKDIKSKELIRKMSSTIDKEKIKALYDSKLNGAATQGSTQGGQKEKEKEKEKQKEKNKPSVPYAEIKKLYLDICKSLPSIRKMTDSRRKHLRARWSEEKDIEIFKEVFKKAENSEFLTGNNDRGWKATFDWIIKNNNNWNKILEGKYNNKTKKKTGQDWEVIT